MKFFKKLFSKNAEAKALNAAFGGTKQPDYQRRLPAMHVEMIQVLIAKGFTLNEIARLFDMAQSSVSHIKKRDMEVIEKMREAFQAV